MNPEMPTQSEWAPNQTFSSVAVQEPAPEAVAGARAAPMFKRPVVWAAAGGLVVVIVGSGAAGYAMGHNAAISQQADKAATAAAASAAAQDSRLSDAYDACTGRDTADTLELADDGNSIIVDTRSEYISTAGVACVLSELGTPESTVSSIDHTTAMMGSRSDEHDGLSYSWSYHPDNGLNLVITNGE